MDMLGYILFGVAAVAAVMLFVLRKQDAARAASLAARNADIEKELTTIKSDTSSRRETLEARTKELAELKEKLRDSKKRLHDEKEVHRKQEIEHARAEAERAAQAQVDAARREAAELQLEVRRLQSELETTRTRRARPEPAPVEKVAEKVEKPVEAAPAEPRPPRELTQVEKDRIAVLEKQAVKQAERVKQIEEELKKNQRRSETTNKVYMVTKSELELARTKLTTLEKRLNRTLLELDKLRQLAFKAGLANEMVAAQKEAEAEGDQAEKKAALEAPPAADGAAAPEAKA